MRKPNCSDWWMRAAQVGDPGWLNPAPAPDYPGREDAGIGALRDRRARWSEAARQGRWIPPEGGNEGLRVATRGLNAATGMERHRSAMIDHRVPNPMT